MRILLVSHGYPPFGVAGVERITEQSARALVAAGHHVTVLSRRVTPAPPLPRIERTRNRDGVDLVMVAGGSAPPGGPFPGFEDRLELIFERLLLEILPDVVVLGHLMSHSPGYVSVARRWRVPVVMELHDFYTVCERAHLERASGELCGGPEAGRACARHCFADQQDGPGRWALRTHLFGLALAHADALICPSEFVADYYRRLGVARERLQVLPNGIPFESEPSSVSRSSSGCEQRDVPRAEALAGAAPASREQPLHLATLAVTTPHKGQHIVVEALYRARVPRTRYTLFGALTQPYARRLREQARRIDGLELRTYGTYDPSSLPLLLGDVDAVIVPSVVWETFSIVTREALACGVPVIASRVGALPEGLREGENGLLFAADSASELAEILQRLDADRTILERLRAGIRPSDWITGQERTRRLETILERVCGERTSPETATIEQPDLGALRTLVGSA